MPTFEITSPDGKTFEVTGPEGSTKEQALEKVKAQHSATPPAEQRSAVGDFFKSIPGGIVEGFSAAASAGGQAAAHEMSQPDVAAEIPAPAQTADILQQNVTGELPKPQGTAGRFGRTLGEFAGSPATWVAPGSTALKAGGMVASALGSEAAGQLMEGHPSVEPWARVLGAIVGGVGATKAAGAVKLYIEKISAMNAKRPKFNLMMKFVERGDTILFHSLSRMGRAVSQVLGILRELDSQGVSWRSLTEPQLNNTTAAGRLMVTITSGMAQHERDQLVERTKRGMDECRRRGQYIGRRKLFDTKQTKQIKQDRKTMTREQAAKKWKCSPGTIDKYTS